MVKKYTKEQLNIMEAVDIYKLVLSGSISRFPRGFWQKPDAIENSKKITKYLLEDMLNWNDEDIKTKINTIIFRQNKLTGMLEEVYDNSVYKTINTTYPDKFEFWELPNMPRGYWTKDNSVKAIKWLIEKKLKWNDEDIKTKLTNRVFIEYGLSGMLNDYFNSLPFNAINAIYPNKFKPWEFPSVAIGYWNLETAKEATRWLIEEKLKWNDEDIRNNLTGKVFADNGLTTMLNEYFNSLPFNAIDAIYPNRFKPWEISIVSRNYWTLETSKEATKWLIEEKLKWNDEDIKNNLTGKVFNNYGLLSMLNKCFKSSAYRAIDNAYPNRFKPWELQQVPKEYWNKKTSKEATKWLIEEKLKWNDEEVKAKISSIVFRNNGLGGMHGILFNGSTYSVLNNAYPEKFKKKDLKAYIRKY